MKILLVTSEVTYVPRNYLDLFEELVARAGEHLVGLVLLKNFSFKLMGDVLGLSAMGASGVSASMLTNIVELPLKKRQKLFEQRGLPVLSAESMNAPEIVSWVREQGIDLVVNLRTRCIYRKEILEAPRLGCLNIHHGLLPEYRGTLCDLHALAEGRPAGFTIHRMNEKIDAGEILVRKNVSLPDGEKDYLHYLERSGREEGIALAELLNQIARDGNLPTGAPNRCPRPVYTRNPDRRMIREMKDKGMCL